MGTKSFLNQMFCCNSPEPHQLRSNDRSERSSTGARRTPTPETEPQEGPGCATPVALPNSPTLPVTIPHHIFPFALCLSAANGCLGNKQARLWIPGEQQPGSQQISLWLFKDNINIIYSHLNHSLWQKQPQKREASSKRLALPCLCLPP